MVLIAMILKLWSIGKNQKNINFADKLGACGKNQRKKKTHY